MRPSALTRRTILAASAAATSATVFAQTTSKKNQVLRWAQLADIGSVNGRIGADLLFGTRLAFGEVNQRGGIFGWNQEIEALDTQGEAARVPALLEGVKARPEVFGMLSIRGTPDAVAAIRGLPGWPIVGCNTGADPLRKNAPHNVIFVRASWSAEVDRLMAVAKNIGISRIAIVYPEGPVGQAAQSLVGGVASKHGVNVTTVATIPHPTSLDVAPAAAKIAASKAQLTVVALTVPAGEFMLEARRAGFTAPMYTLSDAIGPELLDKLKERSRGIGFSSPIPNPWAQNMLIVREYQEAMRKAKKQPKDYTFATMEGYLNGRLVIEALKRVGPDVTRERFIAAARSLKIPDFGGLGVDLTQGNTALTFTDVYILSTSGRVMS
jgi:branched-chain amino acid transport system substrate-binding protein